MENDGNGNGNGRGHYLPWDYWELGGSSSRLDWNSFHSTTFGSDDQAHLMMTMMHPSSAQGANAHPSLQGGDTVHPPSDPHHLTCLKLGKRHYFEERHVPGLKRGRTFPVPSGSVPAPRCQVEGCHVALLNAKDYHRRHKVCEMHSKAPRVVVLGIEQRFCQQCSRFHVVSEFDDSKRSCRRRLAGHNERRRKSATESILSKTASQESKHIDGRFSCISPSTATGRALSLLSSKSSSWVPSADLSSRSSAALRELIAENRAAALARQLMSERSWNHGVDDAGGAQAFVSNISHSHRVATSGPEDCRLVPVLDHFHEPAAHLTLDLMQRPNTSFQILSNRSKSKEEEEGCCEIWRSLEGTHVV